MPAITESGMALMQLYRMNAGSNVLEEQRYFDVRADDPAQTV